MRREYMGMEPWERWLLYIWAAIAMILIITFTWTR